MRLFASPCQLFGWYDPPHRKDTALAYSDPMTITIDGTAHTLNRTGYGPSAGTFSSTDGQTQLTISHIYSRRTRRMFKVTVNKIVSDPLVPSTNFRPQMSAHLVVDQPLNGYTAAEAKLVVDGLIGLLTASSGAAITKLVGGES